MQNIINEYVWRVWKYNKFAGYVTAYSEWHALKLAKEKFGDYILVEMIR